MAKMESFRGGLRPTKVSGIVTREDQIIADHDDSRRVFYDIAVTDVFHVIGDRSNSMDYS